jgi:hypothetical protein
MIKDLSNGNSRARVFISCGQNKDTAEPALAAKIKCQLTDLGFDPYVAVGEQSLRGLKENLFEQLERSEYFVFIDFKRERLDEKDLHRGSLFSHQELAVASYLGIDVLAFREQGVKANDGVLGCIQGNAIQFEDRDKLPEQVAEQVSQRIETGKWNPRWRNELILERERAEHTDPHNLTHNKKYRYFHIQVRNLHRLKTALNCCAYLERVISLPTRTEISFKMFELKWEGYTLPNAHVHAKSVRSFDAFCVAHDQPSTLEFYAFCDASPFQPEINKPGQYELTYIVVADNFAPARRSFILALNSALEETTFEQSD